MKANSLAFVLLGLTLFGATARADVPTALARGEAPLLFTQGKDGAFLRDGTLAHTDDIFLWVPALNAGQVDLTQTGQFFHVWDSGPVAGPNGNDDDDNEMRALHFDAPTGTFLISYDDTTTTGFSDLPSIADGDLIRMTPTSVTNGLIDGFSLTREFAEGFNGTAGSLSEADISGFAVAPDGTFYWSSGSQTLQTTDGGSVSQGSNDFVHTEGFDSIIPNTPRNIGPDIFFDGTPASPQGFVFPTFINGQGRGIDVLAAGDVAIAVSLNFNQPNAADTTSDVILEQWDIGALDAAGRWAEVLYPGSVFFQTIDVDNAEMLGFDILDSAAAVHALLNVLGADSPAGIALGAHVPRHPLAQPLGGKRQADGMEGYP